MQLEKLTVGVIGLGYVGLPVALAFAKKFPGTIGYDVSVRRVETLQKGVDKNGDLESEEIASSTITFTCDESLLKKCNFIVVAVPTPIDSDKRPDLTPLQSASEIVGRIISTGSIVVFESTVYPGVTEDFCGPIIARISGLRQGEDFKLGYSPERINPGDKKHTLERIVKVVSGEDEESSAVISQAYAKIIDAGVHVAPSIKVAEAAKVIENTQRDLNIALMNELAIIFDKLRIPTKEVIKAASTKWNFLPFMPGLVGGHCIGVDPYYLTTKAEQLGYRPRVILAGRSINDSMGQFIAGKIVKMLVHKGVQVHDAKIAILGLTFKENVSDLRNSRVPDIISELREFNINPLICDAYADAHEAYEEYGLQISSLTDISEYDCIVLAVSHDEYLRIPVDKYVSMFKEGRGVFIDVKGALEASMFPSSVDYWAL